MKSATDVFKAIADPTRRGILDLLARSSLSVKELTMAFSVSQPAISQHLGALRAARLVTFEKFGVERRYRLTGEPLREVFEWAAQYVLVDPAGHAWALRSSRKGERHGR